MIARERVKWMPNGVDKIDVGRHNRQRKVAVKVTLQKHIAVGGIHFREITEVLFSAHQSVHVLERRHELQQQSRAAPSAAGNKKEPAHYLASPRSIIFKALHYRPESRGDVPSFIELGGTSAAC